MLPQEKTPVSEEGTFVQRGTLPEEAILAEIHATIVDVQADEVYAFEIANDTLEQFLDQEKALEPTTRRILLYQEVYGSYWPEGQWCGRPKIYKEDVVIAHVLATHPEMFDHKTLKADLTFLYKHGFIERGITKNDERCVVPTHKGLDIGYSFVLGGVPEDERARYDGFIEGKIRIAKQEIGVTPLNYNGL